MTVDVTQNIYHATKYCICLTPSFIFYLMLRNVPITLSQIFFSNCLTSSLHQHGRLKNINCFFHMFFWVVFFCVFLNIISMLCTWSHTCWSLWSMDAISSVKCFLHSIIRMTWSSVHMLQLSITNVFFTYRILIMTLHTISAQVIIYWKLIFSAK